MQPNKSQSKWSASAAVLTAHLLNLLACVQLCQKKQGRVITVTVTTSQAVVLPVTGT
jgi:hypothetical protein